MVLILCVGSTCRIIIRASHFNNTAESVIAVLHGVTRAVGFCTLYSSALLIAYAAFPSYFSSLKYTCIALPAFLLSYHTTVPLSKSKLCFIRRETDIPVVPRLRSICTMYFFLLYWKLCKSKNKRQTGIIKIRFL